MSIEHRAAAVLVVLIVLVTGQLVAVPSGSSAVTARAVRAQAAPQWTGPTRPFSLRRGVPAAVSCPSAKFCQVVDSFGVVYTRRGSGWRQTSRLGRAAQRSNVQVVCESSTWCLASIGTSQIYRYRRSGWTAIHATGGGSVGGKRDIRALACASTSFCVAGGDDGRVFIFKGRRWSGGGQIDPEVRGAPHALVTISCPTATFCVAGDEAGRSLTFNGTVWSKPVRTLASPFAFTSVSCVSSTFCLATSSDAFVLQYDGRTWTRIRPVAQGFYPDWVSCVSRSFCLVLGVQHDGWTVYDGTRLEKYHLLDPRATEETAVPGEGSCASTRSCVALLDDGAAANTSRTTIDTGHAWSRRNHFDPAGGALSRVSCSVGGFCLAADSAGHTKTLRSGVWTHAGSIGVPSYGLSCVSSTFCMTATEDGIQRFNGKGWSPNGYPDDDFEFVSCASTTFCLALNTGGDTSVYNGSRWTGQSPPQLAARSRIAGLSCAAPHHCVIVSSDRDAGITSASEMLDGSTWRKSVMISSGRDPGLSCPTIRFCIVAGQRSVYRYDGVRWSRPIGLGMHINALSCGSATFCVAISSTRASVFDGNTWSTPRRVNAEATALDEVSCTPDRFCLVNDRHRNAYILR